MAENLAPIYVNEQQVKGIGEPKPTVSKVVRVAGKDPNMVEVFRLRSQTDPQGQPLKLEDLIDRTVETNPVFLKCISKSGTSSVGRSPGTMTGEQKTSSGGGQYQYTTPSSGTRPGQTPTNPPGTPGKTPTDRPGRKGEASESKGFTEVTEEKTEEKPEKKEASTGSDY